MKEIRNIQLSNNKTGKVPVLEETKFDLYQSKLKSVAAIKGFAEALEPGFESKLPAKEKRCLDEQCQRQGKTKN